MTDLNNKLNLNNVRNAYTPSYKKEDAKEVQPRFEEESPEIKGDGTQAAESYGRILVKQSGKIENPEMVQGVKDSIEFFVKNPELVEKQMKAGDHYHELMEADGNEHAYEEACCLACDCGCHEG